MEPHAERVRPPAGARRAWPREFGARISAKTVLRALRRMGLRCRIRAENPVLPSGMGWRYRYQWWRDKLKELSVRQSMGRKGDIDVTKKAISGEDGRRITEKFKTLVEQRNRIIHGFRITSPGGK